MYAAADLIWSSTASVRGCTNPAAINYNPDAQFDDGSCLCDYSDWVTVLKTNGDDTFAYDSPHWSSTTSVLNEGSSTMSPGNAKYPEYNTVAFCKIRVYRSGQSESCMPAAEFATPVANAAALFDGEYRREGIVQADWDNIFHVFGKRDCEMQRPGFNTRCNDGNNARWGYCNNVPSQECQTADHHDSDGVIGVGLTGQDCCPMGAGYTSYVVSDSANAGNEHREQVWIQIQPCSVQWGCTAPDSVNYSPTANVDDGSCVCGDGLPPVPVEGGALGCPTRGCTNPAASNHDPQAEYNDGSCTFDDFAQGGGCFEVRCGRVGNCAEDENCAFPYERHEVTCCSDNDLGGWASCTVSGVSVWAERDVGDLECTSDATYADAEATCAAVGARLCTLEELEANCGWDTGCGHNRKHQPVGIGQ